MRRILYADGAAHPVEAEREGDATRVRVDGEPIRAARLGQTLLVTRGRRTREAVVTRRGGEIAVEIGRERFSFGLRRPGFGGGRSGASGRVEVRPPMPGKVVRILLGNGDRVEEGQGVLVYEAMKMQNEVRAPAGGVVAGLSVAEGSPLQGGELLFVVEPAS